MRRNQATLNGQLSRVISETGHTDRIVVTDAGLPIPTGVERVDLAVRPGLPEFLDLLEVMLAELVVEGATMSSEVREHSPQLLREVEERLGAIGVEVTLVPHTELKAMTQEARAAVRSGEFTPYANVILHAGVAY
ncbi:MAG: D-ribose pyranase [Nocardioidaceae bacterium]